MKKTVVIYSTKDSAGLQPWSKLMGVYENSTRRQAFNSYFDKERNYNYKWDIDRRYLCAIYSSGKRHGREKNIYYTAYMTEEEFYKELKKEQDAYFEKYGFPWTKYHK